MEWLVKLLTALAPVIVAIVTIIPTIISNRKKTEQSIKDMNEATDKRVDKLQSSFDALAKDYEATKASSQRYRILRFYDEICAKQQHSESHFEDILDDIDEYEQYCDKHPEFHNNRGHAAMEYIKDTYTIVKANGGFLTHE